MGNCASQPMSYSHLMHHEPYRRPNFLSVGKSIWNFWKQERQRSHFRSCEMSSHLSALTRISCIFYQGEAHRSGWLPRRLTQSVEFDDVRRFHRSTRACGLGWRVRRFETRITCRFTKYVSIALCSHHTQLLCFNLQITGYVPASIMIPQRRFSTLLNQAQTFQRQQCVYHNSPLDSGEYSLYEDHQCDKEAFPGITTAILEIHADEVWNIEWSHDGQYLASASRDKTAIIWRIGVSDHFCALYETLHSDSGSKLRSPRRPQHENTHLSTYCATMGTL